MAVGNCKHCCGLIRTTNHWTLLDSIPVHVECARMAVMSSVLDESGLFRVIKDESGLLRYVRVHD